MGLGEDVLLGAVAGGVMYEVRQVQDCAHDFLWCKA